MGVDRFVDMGEFDRLLDPDRVEEVRFGVDRCFVDIGEFDRLLLPDRVLPLEVERRLAVLASGRILAVFAGACANPCRSEERLRFSMPLLFVVVVERTASEALFIPRSEADRLIMSRRFGR